MPTIELLDDIEIDVPEFQIADSEQAAWDWPDPITPAEWAEEHRELGLDEADVDGPWLNDHAPYLRGIMNLCAAPGVERVSIEKAAQVGVSEACRNLMLFWAHTDPAPLGLALPSKEKGREIVENKVIPAFRASLPTRRLLTRRAHDVKNSQIKLSNGFILHLMWSGSPAAVASNPMKRAISDEVNKHQSWRGVATDPVDSVDKRLRTYADSIHVLVSTPTTRFGKISVEFDTANVRLYFLVPCPHCRSPQRLVFPNAQYPPREEGEEKQDHAYRIVRDELATYECAVCARTIAERQRRRTVLDGRWGTVDEDRVLGDGRITDAEAVEVWPNGTRLGLQISALNCLWPSVSLSTIAAEFIRTGNDRAALFTFRTETLGERWEEQQQRVAKNTFADKSQAAVLDEGLLPWWTDRVLITVDTQHDHFYAVVRAWGSDLLSHRVRHDRFETFEDLDELLATPWHYANDWLPAKTAVLLLIDSGGTVIQETGASRTQDVYAWALKRRARVRAIKGASKPHDPEELYWIGRGVFTPGRPIGRKSRRRIDGIDVKLWMLDTHLAQNMLAEMIADRTEVVDPDTGELGDADRWALNRRDDPTYNAHLSNMHQVVDKVDSKLIEQWVPISDGARVDYRHCEGYQIAAAYMAGVHRLPKLDAWHKQRLAEAKAAGETRSTTGRRMPDGRPFLVTQRK